MPQFNASGHPRGRRAVVIPVRGNRGVEAIALTGTGFVAELAITVAGRSPMPAGQETKAPAGIGTRGGLMKQRGLLRARSLARRIWRASTA